MHFIVKRRGDRVDAISCDKTLLQEFVKIEPSASYYEITEDEYKTMQNCTDKINSILGKYETR